MTRLEELIEGFENGTFPATKWTHWSHIQMAVWYLKHYSLSEARVRIKEGIKKYNVSQGGKNTDSEGYHETITEFYIQVLTMFLLKIPLHCSMEEALQLLEIDEIASKSYVFKYYDKKLLMTKKYRLQWIKPSNACLTIW